MKASCRCSLYTVLQSPERWLFLILFLKVYVCLHPCMHTCMFCVCLCLDIITGICGGQRHWDIEFSRDELNGGYEPAAQHRFWELNSSPLQQSFTLLTTESCSLKKHSCVSSLETLVI